MRYLKRAHKSLVDTHHSTSIVEFTTIVGRREKSDQLTFGKELVAVLDDLMGATYQVEVVFVKKLGHHFDAERERHASIVLAPASDVLVRVGPEQIAE